MKTYHQYTLRYSDTDTSRHIRLCDLERYLLETAGDSADQMGFGTDYILNKCNSAWVLTRVTLMMDYLPQYLEDIEIETWVEGNAHMLSIRNFRIYLLKDGKKELIGKSSTVWTVLNLETRQVDMRVFADAAWEGKIDGEKLDLPRAQRLGRIAEPTANIQHTIHYSDLDYNNHCNSCKYLQFMLNACDSLTGVYPIRVDINYAKEVYKGEHTTIELQETDDCIQYCLLTEKGEVSSTAMLSRYTL